MAYDYEAKKERARKRSSEESAEGRDIAPLPEVVDRARKTACEFDLRLFAEKYFPELFPLEWSEDHLNVIKKIETAVLRGGLFALAMPRGSGKTTLAIVASIWAVVYGHRGYVVLIGATTDAAKELLESIKAHLLHNDVLLDDFPEVCYPIQEMEGMANRCKGQTFNGEHTLLRWGPKQIVLPVIPGSKAREAVIEVAGMTGRIRGKQFTRSDGSSIRPDLVIPDDPQTERSARSVNQCKRHIGTLARDVLGLAGPGKKISGIMPCTVIVPGDVADTILDRDKHPEWNGERTKMVYAFPTNEKLWDEYRVLRAEGMRDGDNGAAATEFYRANREAMDEGAKVAWPARHNDDELSALQHAQNLRFRDEAAFDAEYQNSPRKEQDGNTEELTIVLILGRANGFAQRLVPVKANTITMMIDVQQKLLFYEVCAFEDDFTGYSIDYGTWPDQNRAHFTARDARETLQGQLPNGGVEAAIRKGLDELVNLLCGREWEREDGAKLRIKQGLIDSGWMPSVVAPFCRQSAHAAVLLPSKGRGIRAIDIPMQYCKKQQGEQRGLGVPWRILRPTEGGSIRRVEFDSNYWKSFTAARLRVPIGDRESFTIFGQPDRAASEHGLFSEHLSSEYAVRNEARGNRVDEWLVRPNRENHWWDTTVGCHVAASIAGVCLGPKPVAKPQRRGRNVTYSKL